MEDMVKLGCFETDFQQKVECVCDDDELGSFDLG